MLKWPRSTSISGVGGWIDSKGPSIQIIIAWSRSEGGQTGTTRCQIGTTGGQTRMAAGQSRTTRGQSGTTGPQTRAQFAYTGLILMALQFWTRPPCHFVTFSIVHRLFLILGMTSFGTPNNHVLSPGQLHAFQTIVSLGSCTLQCLCHQWRWVSWKWTPLAQLKHTHGHPSIENLGLGLAICGSISDHVLHPSPTHTFFHQGTTKGILCKQDSHYRTAWCILGMLQWYPNRAYLDSVYFVYDDHNSL